MSPGSQGLPGLMDIPSGAQRRLCKQRAYAMLRKGFQPREAGIFRSREPEPQLRRSSPSRRSRSCLRHFFVLYPPGFFEMKRKLIYVKNGLCRCRSIGKRNFPKMFFFQMCRLDPGFQIRGQGPIFIPRSLRCVALPRGETVFPRKKPSGITQRKPGPRQASQPLKCMHSVRTHWLSGKRVRCLTVWLPEAASVYGTPNGTGIIPY